MAIDIEQHELVPDHEVLSEEDAEAVLDEYGADRNNLPKMQKTDPMAKQLNAEVGDVIEITRPSPTAGETTYYRIVVED